MVGIDIGDKDGRVYRRQGIDDLCVLALSAQARVFQLSFSLCLLLVLFDYRIDNLEAGDNISLIVGLPKVKLVMVQLSAFGAAIGAAVFVLPRKDFAKGLKGKRACHALLVVGVHVFLYPLLNDGVVGKLAFHDTGDGPDVVVICKAHHPCGSAVKVGDEYVFEVLGQRVDDCDLLGQSLVLLLLLAHHRVHVVVVSAQHKPAFDRFRRASAAHVPLAQNGVLPEIGILVVPALFHAFDTEQHRLQRVGNDVCKPCVIGFFGRQVFACNSQKLPHEFVGFHSWSLPVNQIDGPYSHL